MKRKTLLLFVFLFCGKLTTVWTLNKTSDNKKNIIHDEEISFVNLENVERWKNVEVNGETCKIFSASEGDPRNCWCPRGYILCNKEDVVQVKKKLTKMKENNENTEGKIPLWLLRLCDDSKDYGFRNLSVIIDYELAVICSLHDDMKNTKIPQFEIIGAPGYIPLEIVQSEMKENPHYTPRRCTVNNFYLCRKVENDYVNCVFSDWSNWGRCREDGKQYRRRYVIRSNQNNNNPCLWKGKYPPRNIIEDVRTCQLP